MSHVHFKFCYGDFCERFALCLQNDSNDYERVLAKLAKCGYPAEGKTLVHIDDFMRRSVINDSESLWAAIDEQRVEQGDAVTIEYYEPNGNHRTWLELDDLDPETDDHVYFQLKDAEQCSRFSLKLDKRNTDAYKLLMNKLNDLGYKAEGRLLVCIESDNYRTIVDNDDSLRSLIETNGAHGPTVTLKLEYYKPENMKVVSP